LNNNNDFRNSISSPDAYPVTIPKDMVTGAGPEQATKIKSNLENIAKKIESIFLAPNKVDMSAKGIETSEEICSGGGETGGESGEKPKGPKGCPKVKNR
jgi:hypothetical protein